MRCGHYVGRLRFRAIRVGRKVTFVDSTGAFTDSRLGAKMALNKVLMHTLFADDPRYGYPDYERYSLESIHVAHQFLDRFPAGVVVKPAEGGYAGRGVTAGITQRKDLRHASVEAAAFSGDLMIERNLAGASFRRLVSTRISQPTLG